MNLKSEIEYFTDMRLLDKARLLNLFLHELAAEARGTYGPTVDDVLAGDATRPADDVVLRMLLSPRADKVAERLVYNAYSRAIHGFESYDTTVLMGG